MPVELPGRQGRFMQVGIVKLAYIYPLAYLNGKQGFSWRRIVPFALLTKHVLAAADRHDPYIAGTTHGNIGRAAL